MPTGPGLLLHQTAAPTGWPVTPGSRGAGVSLGVMGNALPVPHLPGRLASQLGPLNAGGRETPGWPATLDFKTRLAHGLAHTRPARAWVGLSGRPGGERGAVVAVVTTQLLVFVRRRWTQDPWAEPAERERLAGTWTLLNHLMDCAEQSLERRHWPRGLRLGLIDDDFGQRCWGWAPVDGEVEGTLAPDPMALLRATAAADRTVQAAA